MLTYLGCILLGSLYGLLMGIMPIGGVTTVLITVFWMAHYFLHDPYAGILFLISIVAAAATADSYCSILTGIPGSNSTAPCVIDGYPMTQKGEAGRAMGIAIFDSTVNGVLYASVAFLLLPYFGHVIMFFGTPELAAFMLLSICCVGFVVTKSFYKSLIAIALGLFIGLIGQEPSTGDYRFTFGWLYLGAGIQLIPLVSGLFGIPELFAKYQQRNIKINKLENYWPQIRQGFGDCIKNWRDMMRGGFIGFVTGILPGVGGAVGDLLAYGSTVSKYPNEKFGNGNPKGLLGCEGANNAQKVSSMIPAVLFGIPAAPFAAVVMALCLYFGMEIGSPQLLSDHNFIHSLAAGFIVSTLLVGLLSLFFMKYIIRLLDVPFWIYAAVILSLIVWSNLQYTHGWQDLAMLGICSVLGLVLKHFKISRPAVLTIYIIAAKLENYIKQTTKLYQWNELITRPLFLAAITLSIYLAYRSFRNKGIDYA